YPDDENIPVKLSWSSPFRRSQPHFCSHLNVESHPFFYCFWPLKLASSKLMRPCFSTEGLRLAVLASACLFIVSTAHSAQMLRDNLPAAARQAKVVGKLAADRELRLAIGLPV